MFDGRPEDVPRTSHHFPIKEKSDVLVEESVVFTFPYQANGNHATEPSIVGHVISERNWKSTFDFTEIVNNYGLKRGTVCQIVRFISQFPLKLYIQFWKYFHSVVLGSVGGGYCGKNRVLDLLAKIFVQVDSASLIVRATIFFMDSDPIPSIILFIIFPRVWIIRIFWVTSAPLQPPYLHYAKKSSE